MDPNLKGILTELRVQEEFLKYGFNVSVPVNPSSRYDMIVDIYGRLFKVQCKTSHPIDGGNAFGFYTYSTNKLNGRYYKNCYSPSDVDIFATVFNDTVYLFPYNMITAQQPVFRLNPPRNNQQYGITYANRFQLGCIFDMNMLLPLNQY